MTICKVSSLLQRTLLVGMAMVPRLMGMQSSPLPTDMYCPLQDFDMTYVDKVHLVQPTDEEKLYCLLRFNTEAKVVNVALTYWLPPTVAADAVTTQSEQSVPYLPTAIAHEAPIGAAFYVAGYLERTAQVTVERWSLANVITTQTIPPGGGLPKLGVSCSVRRDVVLPPTSLPPISSMAFHTANGRLWLLHGDVNRGVRTLDPENGLVEWKMDKSTQPLLASATAISPLLIKPTHPSGGGMLFFYAPWRDWSTARLEGTGDSMSGLATYDTNHDGEFDDFFAISWGEVKSTGFLDSADPWFSFPAP